MKQFKTKTGVTLTMIDGGRQPSTQGSNWAARINRSNFFVIDGDKSISANTEPIVQDDPWFTLKKILNGFK